MKVKNLLYCGKVSSDQAPVSAPGHAPHTLPVVWLAQYWEGKVAPVCLLQWARGSCVIFISQGRSLSCTAEGVANVLHVVASSSAAVLQRKGKVAQSCPTLGDPIDYTVHGILQARILEWGAYLFSRGSCWPRNQTGMHCRRILYQLSYEKKPIIQKWEIK